MQLQSQIEILLWKIAIPMLKLLEPLISWAQVIRTRVISRKNGLALPLVAISVCGFIFGLFLGVLVRMAG